MRTEEEYLKLENELLKKEIEILKLRQKEKEGAFEFAPFPGPSPFLDPHTINPYPPPSYTPLAVWGDPLGNTTSSIARMIC